MHAYTHTRTRTHTHMYEHTILYFTSTLLQNSHNCDKQYKLKSTQCLPLLICDIFQMELNEYMNKNDSRNTFKCKCSRNWAYWKNGNCCYLRSSVRILNTGHCYLYTAGRVPHNWPTQSFPVLRVSFCPTESTVGFQKVMTCFCRLFAKIRQPFLVNSEPLWKVYN